MKNHTSAEKLDDKLHIASNLCIALQNTFNDEASETNMPPEKMHAALVALGLVIEQAKDLA